MTTSQANSSFAVLVVGAGHAGCEAALAAARMGATTALVTQDLAAMARMSCNPSIGGIGKGHLVFEIDALGGELGINTDFTAIQYRLLNTTKGRAVQASRAQSDKEAYSRRFQAVLADTANLTLITGTATQVVVHHGRAAGILLANGETITAERIVVTAGTFLNGVIHIGDESRPGGRDGEPAAIGLSESICQAGHHLIRLKTGTPARLARDSIDYGAMECQPGITPPPFFSWAGRQAYRMFHVEHSARHTQSTTFHVEHFQPSALQPWPVGSDPLPCYLTHTTAKTHELVAANLQRSALYGGRITGTGVRYCPSFEDKVVKFPDRVQHHVFIEPEGRASGLVYPNGISNSLPVDVQAALIHSIPGLEDAIVRQWAYGIEYDAFDPMDLQLTLESRHLPGLYLAGQVNGTTGYEEAAAQGFMAAVNAVLALRGEPPLILGRHEAYIGVMLDDLVTKGITEPYRMFTSRAEHRLLLRQDNARYRLAGAAGRLGLIQPDYLAETCAFDRAIGTEIERLRHTRSGERTLLELLRRPGVDYRTLCPDASLSDEAVAELDFRVKYEGYIQQEERQVAKAQTMEATAIPAWVDYHTIAALRREAREKLSRVRPATLGQALRIPGLSPADIAVIAVIMKRGRDK